MGKFLIKLGILFVSSLLKKCWAKIPISLYSLFIYTYAFGRVHDKTSSQLRTGQKSFLKLLLIWIKLTGRKLHTNSARKCHKIP